MHVTHGSHKQFKSLHYIKELQKTLFCHLHKLFIVPWNELYLKTIESTLIESRLTQMDCNEGCMKKKKKKNHMPDIMVWVTYNFISFSQEKIPKMLVMWFLLRSVPQRHVPLRPLGHLCSTTVLHLWQYVMTHFTFISCPAQIAICVHDPQRANHMTFLVAPPVDWHLWCWVEKDWWAQTVV